MTQEEKNLVEKDLCGRLPFLVKVAIDFKGYLEVLPEDEDLEYPYRKNLNFILDYENKTIDDISKEPHILYAYPCSERFAMLRGYTYELDYGVPVEFIKPYLRPMSSMTKAERAQLEFAQELDTRDAAEINISHVLGFYLENHLDYNGLIPMGLALEAKEDMYKTNK